MAIKNFEGVCSYFLTEVDGKPQIVLLFDLSWFTKQSFSPKYLGFGIRNHVKEELKKYTGLDVWVASTAVNNCQDKKVI